jgi:hypothetical protein
VSVALLSAVVIAGSIGALVSAAPAEVAGETTADAPPPQVPLLGVLSSGSGRYGAGTLTLERVQPSAVWFTDRPTRDAGSMDIGSFLELFFRGDDPPNAALAIAGADASGDVAIVELSDPVYRAAKKQVTFKAQLIPDVASDRLAAHPGLAAYVVRNDGSLPKRFSSNALFVDSAAVGSSNGTNVLPPPVASLPASDVEALVSRVATDQVSLQEALYQLRTAIGSGGPKTPCLTDLEQKTTDIYNNLLTEVAPVVRTLQSELAAAGGDWLPGGDVPQYNGAVANLDSIEGGINEVNQLIAYWASPATTCNQPVTPN